MVKSYGREVISLIDVDKILSECISSLETVPENMISDKPTDTEKVKQTRTIYRAAFNACAIMLKKYEEERSKS